MLFSSKKIPNQNNSNSIQLKPEKNSLTNKLYIQNNEFPSLTDNQPEKVELNTAWKISPKTVTPSKISNSPDSPAVNPKSRFVFLKKQNPKTSASPDSETTVASAKETPEILRPS